MISSDPRVRTGLLIGAIVIILVGGIIIFTDKTPSSPPLQNTTPGTCSLGQACEPGTSTPLSKENLTPAESKISTDLLQLIGVLAVPQGLTRVALKNQMEQNHQLTHVAGTGETLVSVYIQTTDAAPTPVDSLVWNVTNRDPLGHLVVAWVDVNKLEKLASLESVRSIRTVSPPITRSG